jgi:uncharacterized MAPEG superfamily protein
VNVAVAVSRRAGLVPGLPLAVGHDSFVFRAQHTHRNQVENLGLLVAAVLLGIATRANPMWINASAVVVAGARLSHMVAFYLNKHLWRTGSFVVGLLATSAALVASGIALVAAR